MPKDLASSETRILPGNANSACQPAGSVKGSVLGYDGWVLQNNPEFGG